jgi:hypothetical protein
MSAYKIALTAAAASAALACAPAAALAAGLDTRAKRSPLPEPATWAMLLTGFAGAGAAIRRGRRYRLVEALPGGQERSEEFSAPDDATALERAALVAEGRMELWRGRVLISR